MFQEINVSGRASIIVLQCFFGRRCMTWSDLWYPEWLTATKVVSEVLGRTVKGLPRTKKSPLWGLFLWNTLETSGLRLLIQSVPPALSESWWLRKKSSMRPMWGAQINDMECKSLICKESENDTFRFPQRNYEFQKVTPGLFATLSNVAS